MNPVRADCGEKLSDLMQELYVRYAVVKIRNMKPGDLAPQDAVL